MANYHYLNINGKTGELYEKSSTPKDGFVKHPYIDVATGDEKVNYHKYYKDNLEGELVDARYIPSDYGDRISFTLRDGEENYIIQMPFEDGGKFQNIGDFAYDFIRKCPNLENGKTYKISPYVYTPTPEAGRKERTYRGITFWHGEDKIEKELSQSYYSPLKNKKGEVQKDKQGNVQTELVEGDIPAEEWSKDRRGKWHLDCREKVDYLFEWFNNYCASEFPSQESSQPQSQSDSTTSQPQQQEVEENTVSEDDVNSDLPF